MTGRRGRSSSEAVRPASPASLAIAGLAAIGAIAVLASTAALSASPVRIQASEGAAAFLGGTFDGVRLDDDGALTLAARYDRVAAIDEPFAFAFAALPDGWAVGTGNDGKVLKVARDGTVSVLFDAPEPEVFALWADPDGTLFAGTSPDGKVYRIRNGDSETYFDPEATYIWAIARGSDGALWVATGIEGKLFRVGEDGQGSVAYDSTEPHLRSLAPLPGGQLLIGTVGQGRVLLRDAAGAVRTLYDSPLAEVVSLVRGADGATYAAVVASEASFVELEPKGRDSAAAPGAAGATDPDSDLGETAAGTRAAGASGPRSELIRLLPDGVAQSLWSSQEETLYALVSSAGRLWLATGAEGRLYSLNEERVRFEASFDERQIVGLLAAADGPVLLTTNAGALYRTAPGPRESGSFTSAVADAGQPARFGRFRWSGRQPRAGGVKVAFRFGSSAVPDETWSDWSAAVIAGEKGDGGGGDTGGETAITAPLPARYYQFRIDLSGAANASPVVERTEVAYRQINQRPKIERFGALEPGQILVPANFNPTDQVYEPASPNRDGIFTTLEPAAADPRTKQLWKRGMRTLRWRASDPNGDELRATLALRPEPEGGGAAGSADWLEIVTERKEEYFSFDATALPDGRYRFRVTVTDLPGNDAATALLSEETSEVVIVDHAPPRRQSIERRGGGARLTIADDWNPLVSAEISYDAGEWRDLAPLDGLVDSRSETFDLGALPRDARLVLLRVTDAAWNVATFDLGPEIRP